MKKNMKNLGVRKRSQPREGCHMPFHTSCRRQQEKVLYCLKNKRNIAASPLQNTQILFILEVSAPL